MKSKEQNKPGLTRVKDQGLKPKTVTGQEPDAKKATRQRLDAKKATSQRPDAKTKADKTARAQQPRHRLLTGFMVTLGVAFCLVFATVTLYPVLREYYITSRDYELLILEREAVLNRNARIEEQIAKLQTDEGIQDRAREQFGWVMEGEQAINITGLPNLESSTALPPAVIPGSLEAEASWWIDFLDWFFDIDTNKPIQELYDPFIS